jgi:hypothetical protein
MRLLVPLALVLVLILGAAGYYREFRHDAPPQATVAASVDGVRFSYPAAYARDGATRMGGALDRLAFLTVFPDFAPAPAASADPQRRAAQALDPTHVFIAIAPRDEAIDPAERPSHLYARFLESEVWAAPGGLMLRRFEVGSPYELEQLYLAPPDGAVFFARCPKREAGFMGAASCIWALRRDRLDVEVRFAPALLEHWSRLVEGTRGFLTSVEARSEPPSARQ